MWTTASPLLRPIITSIQQQRGKRTTGGDRLLADLHQEIDRNNRGAHAAGCNRQHLTTGTAGATRADAQAKRRPVVGVRSRRQVAARLLARGVQRCGDQVSVAVVPVGVVVAVATTATVVGLATVIALTGMVWLRARCVRHPVGRWNGGGNRGGQRADKGKDDHGRRKNHIGHIVVDHNRDVGAAAGDSIALRIGDNLAHHARCVGGAVGGYGLGVISAGPAADPVGVLLDQPRQRFLVATEPGPKLDSDAGAAGAAAKVSPPGCGRDGCRRLRRRRVCECRETPEVGACVQNPVHQRHHPKEEGAVMLVSDSVQILRLPDVPLLPPKKKNKETPNSP